MTDQEAIEKHLLAVKEKYKVKKVAIDPKDATKLSTELIDEGFNVEW